MRDHKQQGAAIVTALFFMSLAATLAIAMLFHQSIDIRRAQIIDDQSQIATADSMAQAWALSVLKESWLQHTENKYDGLDQVWAKPMPKFTLGRVSIEAKITDAHSLFNLNNIRLNGGGKSLKNMYDPQQVFVRLMMLLNAGAQVYLEDIGRYSLSLKDWLKDKPANTNMDEESPYLKIEPLELAYRAAHMPMTSISELRLLYKMQPKVMLALSEHIIALPLKHGQGASANQFKKTKVNINTASAELLSAITMLDLDKAKSLLSARPYNMMSKFTRELNKLMAKPAGPSTKKKDGDASPQQSTHDSGFKAKEWFSVQSNDYMLETVLTTPNRSLLTYKMLHRNDDGSVVVRWQSIGSR